MNWEYVQEGTGNFLRILSDDRETFADEMFSYQDIQGFLPLEIRCINGKKEAFYDITGKIPLRIYLKEQKFTLSVIRDIFRQILDLEEELEEYLLEGCGLLVHPDYLYVEKGTQRIWGIYNGEHTDGDITAFGTLLEFVMEYMNQKDRELVFFIYGMHKLTKEAGCTRGDLRSYLMEREETGILEIRENAGQMQSGTEKSGEIKTKRTRVHPREKNTIENIPVMSILLLVTGVVIPVILWQMGIFTMSLSGEINWGRCLGASAFFIVICGYGAWKLMPVKGFKWQEVFVRTEEETDTNQLCLIPEQSGDNLIPVRHFPFLIGKDDSQNDVRLEGSGVSRVHLQIVQEAGELYAIDQESAGGTYHNGNRMVPWERENLRDGDFLTIGSHEYVVEITSSEYVM